MALSSLLDIVKRATDELALSQPTAIASLTTVDPRQYLALLNTAGRELMKEHDWGDLITLTTIITVSGTSDYAVASDYDRMVADTQWNRTTTFPITGPIPAQYDRAIRESSIAQAGVFYRFRQIGKTYVRITPTPTVSSETLAYEYVSAKWARSSGNAAQLEFQADTDTSVFDANLLVKELKWRFISSKGFDASALKIECDRLKELIIAGDIGGTVLNLGGSDDALPLTPSIVDGSWSI